MSLRDLARQRLAIIRGEKGDDTNTKQRSSVFRATDPCFTLDETGFFQKTAINDACFTVSPPRVGNSETDVSEAVAAGLEMLTGMSCPPCVDWETWQVAIADAHRVVRDGWAAKGFALGWTDLDLFGCVPDPDGDPAGDGLSVWLRAQKLLALSADYAVVEAVGGGRSYFNRREATGAVLLWALGQ